MVAMDMTKKMARRNTAVVGRGLPVGSSSGEMQDLQGREPLPPQKPAATVVRAKRSSWLERERAWYDKRWDLYLQFKWHWPVANPDDAGRCG